MGTTIPREMGVEDRCVEGGVLLTSRRMREEGATSVGSDSSAEDIPYPGVPQKENMVAILARSV